jgi:hypothetical protein
MLADAHRKAAEEIESTILSLQAQPRAARVVIEGAWVKQQPPIGGKL